MDVGAPLASSSGVPRVAARLATPPFVLAGLVALSSLLQTLLAWRRPTPGYFPDEYMYAELGRSLLESGSPLVRSENAHFLPLLYPLLTAPAWLWDDVEHAFRTIQAVNAVTMSLAAVPAFLLARRLRVGDRLALATAAVAVLLPELLYSSSLLAETLAYPLALAAAAAAVAALERPTLRLQLVMLAFCGLAASARLQLAVLPLCYLLAVVAVGLRDGRLRATLRKHAVAVGAIALALVAGLGAAVVGTVGIYGDVTAYSVEPLVAVRGFGANALVLAYAAGWVIVPGALIGVALALAQPRSRAELGFAVFAVAELALLLVQASVVGDAGRVQERYAMYALPLLVVAFALYASRGWPHLRAYALLAGVVATAAAVVPLAGYAAEGSGQSVVLAALRHLEGRLGDVGLASLTIALGASALSAVVLAAAYSRRGFAASVALTLTTFAALATTSAAFAFQHDARTALRTTFLPSDPSWIDAAADEPVTLLVGPRSTRADLLSTLFWNRSVHHLALLDGADRPDAFAVLEPAVDGAGRLDLPAGLVLTDMHGSTILLRDAERVAAGPTKTLWRSDGGPQLELLAAGRYFTGLMATDGGFRVWPSEPGGHLAGWLELELAAAGTTPVPFVVELPGRRTLRLPIPPRTSKLVRIPVCSIGVWTAGYSSGSVGIVHGTRVGLRSSEPRLVADPAACP
ncbi:MAG TPA: hypothetical protein VEW11_05200 [Gaiellaceae bacterium]|nr:hypothetical protein [Gaiellaceae bacterium]